MFSGFYLALLLILAVPDRPRPLVRVARARREQPAAGGRSGPGRTRSGRSARRCSGASRSRASCTASRSRPTRPTPATSATSSARYSVARRDRRLPALRPPRRGLPRRSARSVTFASGRAAPRRASHPRPRSSAPASSSGRSSSRTTETTRASSRASSPSRSRPSPPSRRSSSCGRATSAGRSSATAVTIGAVGRHPLREPLSARARVSIPSSATA